MRLIYENIIYSLQKAGGVSLYWTQLIDRVSKKSNVVFYEHKNENIFRKKINISTIEETSLSFRLYRYLPFIKKLASKSIFHSSYYRTSLQKDIVKIVTVYDFTYERYKSGLARLIHTLQKKFAIKNADGVICISESTKNDLFKFLPKTTQSKVKTIYISAGEEFYPIKDLKNIIENSKFRNLANKKIILYVGDRASAYKNFSLAVDTLSRLPNYILVSIGAGEITNDEQALINKKLSGNFLHYTGIGSDDLNLLYNLSFCLIYPSSYEGFGIPILEAMRAGCPVISTNFSSIPEVAGNAAILVNTINTENFIKSIKLLENLDFRSKLIEAGFIQAKRFSWNKCAEETIDFYKQVSNWKFNK